MREPALLAVRTKVCESDYAALQSLSDKTRISMGALMRAAIAEFLRNNDSGKLTA